MQTWKDVVEASVDDAPHGIRDARGYWQQVAAEMRENGIATDTDFHLLVRSCLDAARQIRQDRIAERDGEEYRYLFAV